MSTSYYISESNRLVEEWSECARSIRENLKDSSKIDEIRTSIAKARTLLKQGYEAKMKALAAAPHDKTRVILKGSAEILTPEDAANQRNAQQQIVDSYERHLEGLAGRKAKREELLPIIKESNRRFHALIPKIQNELNNITDPAAVIRWIDECRTLDQTWRDATIEFIQNKGVRKYKSLGERPATEADVIQMYKKTQEELDDYGRRLAISLGHAHERHGRKDITALDERLHTERKVEASSFVTDEHLETFVFKALKELDRSIVEWRAGRNDRLTLYYENEEIQATLLSKKQGHNPLQFPTKLKVILIRDANLPTGYYVETAYLVEV